MVTAVQWTGDRFSEPIPDWLQEARVNGTLCYGSKLGTIVVYDRDTNMRTVCEPGDYIALFDGTVTGFGQELFEAMFVSMDTPLADLRVGDILDDDITKPLHDDVV